jgi:FMN-dependent oxidoreductase (nitrilotriacetate monooxygenase family)
MPKQMHLMSFLTNSPMNHTVLSWAKPEDQRADNLGSLAHWVELGKTLERGCFDAIFFADTLGGFDWYKQSMDHAIRYGVWWPTHDPAPILAAIAAATTHLGLALTLSVSGTHPYIAVRTLSTLDYLSGGRVGWNVVTGAQRSEHQALGMDQLDHDERYDRADEYLRMCHALWNSVPQEAVLIDKERQIFADPEKIEHVRFEGKYLRTDGVSPVLPSPQGRPVIFQAGTSPRGTQFALRHSDVIFAIRRHRDNMVEFMQELRETANGSDPKVVFGMQAIVGSTEADAKRKQEELADMPIEAALTRFSGSMGVDFSQYDLDRPMEEMDTQQSRGLMAAAAAAVGNKRLTLREAAMLWGTSSGMPKIAGTPEQVADEMEAIWRATGCHGFNITPGINTQSIVDFVDQVVPLLQKRGIFRKEYEYTTLRQNLFH